MSDESNDQITVEDFESKGIVLPWDAKRKIAYPPFIEYLDGVVKGDQAQIDKYIADCLAVKAKYPKDAE
jgi:hypothetical protein